MDTTTNPQTEAAGEMLRWQFRMRNRMLTCGITKSGARDDRRTAALGGLVAGLLYTLVRSHACADRACSSVIQLVRVVRRSFVLRHSVAAGIQPAASPTM